MKSQPQKKKRVKKVKAWIVVSKTTHDVRGISPVYLDRDVREVLGLAWMLVPCTITYQIPNKKNRNLAPAEGYEAIKGAHWELKTDSLEDQSDETLTFLSSLLNTRV